MVVALLVLQAVLLEETNQIPSYILKYLEEKVQWSPVETDCKSNDMILDVYKLLVAYYLLGQTTMFRLVVAFYKHTYNLCRPFKKKRALKIIKTKNDK